MARFWRSRGLWVRWLLAALVETAAALPWMLFLYAADGEAGWLEAVPGAWLPLAVFLAAAVWESGSRGDARPARVGALVAGAAMAYLAAYALLPAPLRTGVFGLNPALAFVPVAVYLWYAGARCALEGLEYGRLFERAWRLFGGQLAGIVCLLLLGEARSGPVQLVLGWSVVLLFGAGLSLLILTRERALLGAFDAEEQAAEPTSPAVTGFVLALLAGTVAASAVLTVDRVATLLRAVGRLVAPVYNVLVQVAAYLAMGVAMLLEPLFNLLRWLASQQEPTEQGGGEDVAPGPPDLPPDAGAQLDLEPVLKAGLILVAVALAALLLWRMSAVRRRTSEVDEERTSLGFWASLWQDLRGLLQARRTAGAVGDGAGEEPVPPGSARELYRRLQRWGSSRVRPRRPAETPNAYRSALAGAQPRAADAVDAVTEVYNQERYGSRPPDAETVAEAAALWEASCERDFTV
ncbi:DUF4129 domain-containing protein [Symbiobacterium thermophilum]|uniref:DUF4129 domain-containing protein n=1 Tax=Symbiobacterium thermophilum TaxID=2734 RepID=UPI0035C73A1F